MRAGRVLLAVMVTVWVALVAPNLVIDRSAALWAWLATAQSGSDASVLGAARAADPDQTDVVILGSSMAGANVSTWMLERDSGRPTVNLGVNGISAIGTAMWAPEVERLTPSAVVWITGPMALEDVELREETAFDWRMAWAAWGPRALLRGDVWSGALADASRMVRLRRIPLRVLQGRMDVDPMYQRGRGRIAPERFRRSARRHAHRLREQELSPDGPGARAMRATVQRFVDQGIEVILVPAPVHARVVRGGNFWEPHTRIVHGISTELGVRFIGPNEQPEWVDTDFRDPIHLDRSGQRKITTMLIEELQ